MPSVTAVEVGSATVGPTSGIWPEAAAVARPMAKTTAGCDRRAEGGLIPRPPCHACTVQAVLHAAVAASLVVGLGCGSRSPDREPAEPVAIVGPPGGTPDE